MHASDVQGFEKLTVPEKILLVEELWERIGCESSSVPIPSSHAAELDRRLERHESSPGNLLTLDELKQRIESRK